MKIFEKFMELLSPDNIKCIVCEDELPQDSPYGLCDKCLDKLPYVNKACNRCGREIYDMSSYCFDCKEGGMEYDKVYSCLNYEDFVHLLVYKLKYGGEKYLAKYMAQIIIDKIKGENITADYILPVPLNQIRQQQRGFNQAELLAQCVSRECNIPLLDNMQRVRNTPFQASLSREERLVNLKDAFKLKDKALVKGKTILLLDDIFTTGTTINECSKVLKKAGASKVLGITYAHAKKKFV